MIERDVKEFSGEGMFFRCTICQAVWNFEHYHCPNCHCTPDDPCAGCIEDADIITW